MIQWQAQNSIQSICNEAKTQSFMHTKNGTRAVESEWALVDNDIFKRKGRLEANDMVLIMGSYLKLF